MTMPVSLTRRGWGFALAAAALGASWLAVGLRDLWYLVALLAALVVVALCSALILPRAARIEVRLSTTDPTPTAGDEVELIASVRHRLPFALDCRIAWSIEGGGLETPCIATAGTTALSRTRWSARRRGPAVARIASITVLDPLGLATGRVRIEAGSGAKSRAASKAAANATSNAASNTAVELLILPRRLSGLDEHLDHLWLRPGEGEPSNSRAVGRDAGSPGGAVREYRSGDAPRQIHWKQSARQGELLVKLPEVTDTPERALRLVTDAGAYTDPGDARLAATAPGFELAVSAAATVAADWIHHGYTVRLLLDGERPALLATESEMLRALAVVTLTAADPGSGDAGANTGAAVTAYREASVPPRAVATGAVTERLADELARSGSGGVVFAARGSSTATPHGWIRVLLSRGGGQRA